MQAQAAIDDGSGQLSLETVDVAYPLGDEVLVELRAAGICHTDHASLNWKRPLVMGHEGAGVVREVGPLVRHVRPGDAVVLSPACASYDMFKNFGERGMIFRDAVEKIGARRLDREPR